jgi:hypothetical protein
MRIENHRRWNKVKLYNLHKNTSYYLLLQLNFVRLLEMSIGGAMHTQPNYTPFRSHPALDSLDRLEAAKGWIERCDELRAMAVGAQIENSSLFQSHRDRVSSFGYSIRAFLLYAQIGGAGLTRSPGLFIEFRGVTFAVGLYLRENTVNAHLISPCGPNWQSVVAIFAKMLLNTTFVDKVYVRHIAEAAAKELEQSGFEELNEQTSWCARAMCEDESFNHRLVNLSSIIARSADGALQVRNLESDDSGNFKTKFRAAFQRGENFMQRNGLVYMLRPYTAVDALEVKALVHSHFEVLEQSGTAIGSCALDYQLLIDNLLDNTQRHISLVGVLRSGEQEIITSIFLGEKTGESSGGLYCSITNRSPENLLRTLPDADLTGFTALPQYSLARLFGELECCGWKSVDLGGSETEDLDRFKRQMGAEELKTTWRVMR